MTYPALSYVNGASTLPLLSDTIGQSLDKAAATWPDSSALIAPTQNIHWTWGEFHGAVEAFAAGLLALGLQRGDRIGIWSLNRAEWVVVQFAAAKAGLVLVTLNPAYRLMELEFALAKVGCKVLITATQFKSSDYIGMISQILPELATSTPGLLHAARLPALRALIQIGGPLVAGAIPFESVAGMGGVREYQALSQLASDLQFDDPINIQFTSGTTGQPKGVTLTHHNILNNGYFVARAMQLTALDRICIPVPLYHCFGMVMANLACVTHGCAMVFPGEGFDPQATLQTIESQSCTVLYGVPTMFIAELDHPDFAKFNLGSLRTGIMAGAPCPIEVMRNVVDRMNMRDITICYGMTETSPVSFQSSVDDTLDRRVATVGRIHPHLEVKIVDTQGRIVPRGAVGELCTRGYSVMLGYWDEPEKTAAVLDNARWMHTGDLATLDADGFGNIVGRIKDLIIRGGENISPREVEEYLYRHPKILDVQVFGIADQRYGEEICAWVKVREGEKLSQDEVIAFCKGQIAHNKIPRIVQFVEHFPMTVTGKIQKFQMRAAVELEFGLQAQKTA